MIPLLPCRIITLQEAQQLAPAHFLSCRFQQKCAATSTANDRINLAQQINRD